MIRTPADHVVARARLGAFWVAVATVSVMSGCGSCSCVKEEESVPLPKANLADPIDAQAVGVVRPALAPDIKRLAVSPDAQQ